MSDELNNKLLEINNFGFSNEDFTDDGNYPTVNKLIRAMDQILYIINRQQGRLSKEISQMSDKESDRLYKHKFLQEFKIDIIP